MNTEDEKNLLLAYLITFLIPGAGHIYIGRKDIGLNYVLAIASSYVASTMIIFLLPVSLVVWIVCLFKTMPRLSRDFDAVIGNKNGFFAKQPKTEPAEFTGAGLKRGVGGLFAAILNGEAIADVTYGPDN